MKIAIMGYSGSGKSTLARRLGERYGIPVLHLDQVEFLPGWVERDQEEAETMVEQFLDAHDSWIIDGNYSNFQQKRRLEEADRIVLLLFDRFSCLRRVWKRHKTYRGRSRPDVTEGCNEKLDASFVWWVLWQGRNRTRRERFLRTQLQYPEKTTVIRTQWQLDRFRKKLEM